MPRLRRRNLARARPHVGVHRPSHAAELGRLGANRLSSVRSWPRRTELAELSFDLASGGGKTDRSPWQRKSLPSSGSRAPPAASRSRRATGAAPPAHRSKDQPPCPRRPPPAAPTVATTPAPPQAPQRPHGTADRSPCTAAPPPAETPARNASPVPHLDSPPDASASIVRVSTRPA
jgi:hypothetical protein